MMLFLFLFLFLFYLLGTRFFKIHDDRYGLIEVNSLIAHSSYSSYTHTLP